MGGQTSGLGGSKRSVYAPALPLGLKSVCIAFELTYFLFAFVAEMTSAPTTFTRFPVSFGAFHIAYVILLQTLLT